MPYLIAIVVVVVAGVAFTFFQSSPAPEPEVTTTNEEARPPENDTATTEVATEPTPIQEQSEEPDISVVSEVIDTVPDNEDDLTAFTDGTYTTQTSYFTPRRTEHTMDVTLTLEGDIVTDVSILWDGSAAPKTPSHSGFDAAFEAEVIGQPLNEIFLSRVGGASLTSEAFNEAVETVEIEASAS